MLFLHPLPLERRRVLARGWQSAGNPQCGLLDWQDSGSRGCELFTFVQFVGFHGSEAVTPGKASSPTWGASFRLALPLRLQVVHRRGRSIEATGYLTNR